MTTEPRDLLRELTAAPSIAPEELHIACACARQDLASDWALLACVPPIHHRVLHRWAGVNDAAARAVALAIVT